MRIAAAGTHCVGKSTLIEEFLHAHPDFAHEPEPYAVLQEDYGEAFAAAPSAEDFYRQLEFNVGRLRRYQRGDRVISERSPADFLAYVLALNDLARVGNASVFIEDSVALVKDAIPLLDLIVFLPINDSDSVPDSEDLELRRAVDVRLAGILVDDDFGLFTGDRPVVLEAQGSTSERLRTLEDALGSEAQ